MDLSIVIVNWNTRDLLTQCLDSIYGNPPQRSFQVWVIDNNSSDASSAMVRERFPRANLIANDTNVGFARANNQGIRQSTGQLVLLLNSDTRVHPGALDRLVDYMEDHPKVGVAGVRLLNLDGSIQYYPTSLPRLSNQLAMLWYLPGRREFLTGRTGQHEPCEVDRVKGACLAVRHEVLDQIGLMDEGLFLYAEEDDICQRARQAGWKIVFLPSVLVTHYGGASTEQMSEQALIHLYRGKLWFVRKYRGRLEAGLLKLVIGASYLARILWANLNFFAKRNSVRTKVISYLRLLAELPGL